ncbi:hypothetical protein SNOG_01648 [Parastagonospora nodorum SN15]|uniref:Uncharacterized protein n=1 Tax=Phaeosphaeria nodorum (strain SN15 / ATCC MYA-4574 / FGSC 10173) TaxID=321614 RepID=Q0V2W6_PHANO|nr:hypothetical protein SNOG_01648 [Parastagonospora nodorum SN15]EAT91297.2 hypothetical protein SNOG_01648 [Parastagonospora nodorum SN15]
MALSNTGSTPLTFKRSLRPILRRNGETKWPHGVASGGTVTDMLEHLSLTKITSDYAIVIWLQAHYIEPFGRIERLDGLVVNDEPNRVNLEHAYERYVSVLGGFTRDQKLWVPGLEPTNPLRRHGGKVTIPETPLNIEYKDWRASEIFSKNGHEVMRKSKFESSWTDANRWSRTIWSAPSVKTVVKNADLARQSFQPSWTLQAPTPNKVVKGGEPGSEGVAKIDRYDEFACTVTRQIDKLKYDVARYS